MEVQKAIDILSGQIIELGNQNVLMQRDIIELKTSIEKLKTDKSKFINTNSEGLD